MHGLPYPITNNHKLRMKRIGERIVAEHPDVAVLQEVWPGSIDPLVAATPGYSSHYVPRTFGSPSGGLVILMRDGAPWSVDEASLRFRAFSEYGSLYRIWEGDGIGGKGALFVALIHAASGRRLWLTNTHLQSRYGADKDAPIRFAQVRELDRWLHEIEGPVAIAGDFNTLPIEKEIYEAMTSLGIDVTEDERRRTGGATKVAMHVGSPPRWIDYVLVRPGSTRLTGSTLRLIHNERMDHPYSDHSALIADITLAP